MGFTVSELYEVADLVSQIEGITGFDLNITVSVDEKQEGKKVIGVIKRDSKMTYRFYPEG